MAAAGDGPAALAAQVERADLRPPAAGLQDVAQQAVRVRQPGPGVRVPRVGLGQSIDLPIPYHAAGTIVGPKITPWSRGVTVSPVTTLNPGDLQGFTPQTRSVTLTVGAAGAPRSVILAGGAQPKNVFWQVGSSATINAAGGGTMVGTIISSAATSFSTAGNPCCTTLNGRALALNASVTMVNTVINVPAP